MQTQANQLKPTAPHRTARAALIGLLCVTAAGLLRWATPALPPLTTHDLSTWFAATAPADVLVTLAGCCAWLCLCWLLLGVVLVLLADVPGGLGRLAAATSQRCTPVLLRRTVQAALGTALVASPVAMVAAPALAAPRTITAPAASSGHGAGEWPDLDRQLGAPAIPAHAGRHAPPRPPHAGSPAPAAAVVVVRPGDTLWRIARLALPEHATAAEVAAEWPRWYAANRHAIGPDPNLLRPGQVLHAPKPAP